MKSSIDRLLRFELYKSGSNDKRSFQPSAHVDELAQAAQVRFFFLVCFLLSATFSINQVGPFFFFKLLISRLCNKALLDLGLSK